jgi:hypothetical protein
LALIEDLGAGPVGIDTAIVIYLIEENQRFLAAIAPRRPMLVSLS